MDKASEPPLSTTCRTLPDGLPSPPTLSLSHPIPQHTDKVKIPAVVTISCGQRWWGQRERRSACELAINSTGELTSSWPWRPEQTTSSRRCAWREWSCTIRTGQRRGSSGRQRGLSSLVLGNLDLLLLGLSALERAEVAAALETLGGHKALDLGAEEGFEVNETASRVRRPARDSRLGVGLGTLGLGGNLTTDDELANIVGLVEVKEAANLGSTLWVGKGGRSGEFVGLGRGHAPWVQGAWGEPGR